MSRTLLVGLAPEREGRTTPFVGSRSGATLARLMGLRSDSELPELFELANLLETPEWPGAAAANRRAASILDWCHAAEIRDVALFGQTVASAFAVPFPLACVMIAVQQRGAWRHVTATSYPHPSGLCRWWNDLENRGLGRESLRGVADRARALLV